MFKRLLSSVLACLITISGFTAVKVSAVSEDDADVTEAQKTGLALDAGMAIEVSDRIEHNPVGNEFYLSPYKIASPFSLFSNGNTSTYNFFDILTTNEKAAYNFMKSAVENALNSSGENLFDEELTNLDGELLNRGLYIPLYDDAAGVNVTGTVAAYRAYCAFVADYPEYFWLANPVFYYEKDIYGNEVYIDAMFGICAGQTADDIKSRYSALMNTVSSVVSGASGSDYDKIKYFAEYISDKMSYNDNAALYGDLNNNSYANCWNAYGALISGDGVCEAYAEAFKLLCDEAGIPCTSVYSHDHEWNAVKLGNKWYYVDVTWIDTGNKNTYQYDKWLAVGTTSAQKNDNAGKSHTPSPNAIIVVDGTIYPSNFTYPTISTTNYSSDSTSDSGSGSGGGSGSGDNSDTGNNSGTGNTSSGVTVNTKNKGVTNVGSTNYKFTVLPVTPVINVFVPSSISAVINPYGISVVTKDGYYGADGITSQVYTIRNMTQTSAVAVRAKAYLTVPKDKTGLPTITVCEDPDEVKSKDEKALSAYLLACVSESSVTDANYESKDLVAENDVQYVDGETIVFADATVNSENANSGTLMVIPRTDDEGGYYYGHFRISGEVSNDSMTNWDSTDKINLVVAFNIVPCADPT